MGDRTIGGHASAAERAAFLPYVIGEALCHGRMRYADWPGGRFHIGGNRVDMTRISVRPALPQFVIGTQRGLSHARLCRLVQATHTCRGRSLAEALAALARATDQSDSREQVQKG